MASRKMQIRFADISDAKAAGEISEEAFIHPWKEEQIRDAIDSENAIVLVAEEDGAVCGYAVLYFAGGDGELESIAVKEECRGKGIGKCLLNALIDETVMKGNSRIFLEVREKNPAARKLYENAGFKEIGIRKNFYKEINENAVLMRLDTEAQSTEREIKNA